MFYIESIQEHLHVHNTTLTYMGVTVAILPAKPVLLGRLTNIWEGVKVNKTTNGGHSGR